MNHEEPRQHLIEILKKFDTLMMISDAPDHTFHGRPMAVAEISPSGELWFASSRDSGKVREVAVNARALVTGQGGGAYVSVSGHLDVVEDRARVRALWRESWKVWFPQGKDDPNLVLMRLRPDHGEYWSQEGAAGVRYLFEAAKALITGERPSTDNPEQHAKVKM